MWSLEAVDPRPDTSLIPPRPASAPEMKKTMTIFFFDVDAGVGGLRSGCRR